MECEKGRETVCFRSKRNRALERVPLSVYVCVCVCLCAFVCVCVCVCLALEGVERRERKQVEEQGACDCVRFVSMCMRA